MREEKEDGSLLQHGDSQNGPSSPSSSRECLGHSQGVDLLRWFLAVLWVVEWFSLTFRMQGFRESSWSFSEQWFYEAEWLGAVLAALCLLLGIKFLQSRTQLGLVLSIIGLAGTQVPRIREIIMGHLRWVSEGVPPHYSWQECVSIDCMFLAKPLCYAILTITLAFTLRRLRYAR